MERKVQFNGKSHVLVAKEFDEEIDIDAILQIDMTNLIGEVVNFPVIVNRFGIMLAQAETKLAKRKAEMEILEARLREDIRKEYEDKGYKAPTVSQLDDYVTTHPNYRAKQALFIAEAEEKRILESTMWCAKDKSEKLNKLSLSIQPGDVEETLQDRGKKKLIR